MMADQWPWLVATVAWVLLHLVVLLRARDTRSIDEYPAAPGDEPPLVSVIIPARNEARSIERCVRSVIESSWPRLEVIVVDDHSTDGTGEIVRRLGPETARAVRVIEAPPLPAGWFGKQWACHSGASVARGSLLCFTDADTHHGPELLARSVNAMAARGSHLFTVAGTQEMGTFWEKVIQPYVFTFLQSHYGGVERISRSRDPERKIANGQFIIARRDTYDAMHGHEAVRSHVAEDLRLAQTWTAAGLNVHIMMADGHLFTRMYTSLAELRRGWGKNVFAGGRDALFVASRSRVLRALFPIGLPIASMLPLLPWVVLALAGVDLAPIRLAPMNGALVFGLVGTAVSLAGWAMAYRRAGLSPLWGLSHPLAALAFGAICTEAAWRGSRVEWKGREYVSRSA